MQGLCTIIFLVYLGLHDLQCVDVASCSLASTVYNHIDYGMYLWVALIEMSTVSYCECWRHPRSVTNHCILYMYMYVYRHVTGTYASLSSLSLLIRFSSLTFHASYSSSSFSSSVLITFSSTCTEGRQETLVQENIYGGISQATECQSLGVNTNLFTH